MKRVSFGDLFTLNAYWLGLSFMWNSLHVIVLPAVLWHLVPETQKNTYLGLLTFVGLVIAMFLQPVAGALSDRWASRWGRRRPLIFLGTAFDFIFLALLGWAGGLGWLVAGYIGLQLTSNVAHGALQGLLPDRVPSGQLGRASGIKNLMDMAGLVAASLLVGRLLSPEERHPVGVMALVSLILAAGAAITLLGARETPSHESAATSASNVFDSLREVFRVDIRAHGNYWWLIVSRFAFLLSVYGIQTFAQYYVRDVLAAPNPVQLTGDLLAAITLALIAFALAGGWLSDRFGRKRLLIIASGLSAAGCLLMLLARTPTTLLLFGSVLGAGVGLFLTANWALANDLAPVGEAGKFLGLTNLATAGAAAAGRLEGPLIDLLNNAQPGAFWGYTMLFAFGAVCAAVSALLVRRVTEK